MPSQTLNEILNGLNEQQKNAAQTIEGPVQVIAGPGTGENANLSFTNC